MAAIVPSAAKPLQPCAQLEDRGIWIVLIVLEKKLLSLSNVEFATEKALESIKVPKGLSLPIASANRSFTFDPSIVVQESIKDSTGNIIVAKGTRYNPLINHSLNTPILFFNGGDPIQLT